MKPLNPLDAARAAVSSGGERPATAVIHDTADLRLVVFRIEPGQVVPPHRSVSTVMLSVLEGDGVLVGEAEGEPVERDCRQGDAVAYEPNELHSMRAGSAALLLLATISPRPGSR